MYGSFDIELNVEQPYIKVLESTLDQQEVMEAFEALQYSNISIQYTSRRYCFKKNIFSAEPIELHRRKEKQVRGIGYPYYIGAKHHGHHTAITHTYQSSPHVSSREPRNKLHVFDSNAMQNKTA